MTSDPSIAIEADGLVVPGVGAFAACMKGILDCAGEAIINERVAKSRPILGICVGMQVLFSSGNERGVTTPGLGYFGASVDQIAAPVLPHMGWNTVDVGAGSALFRGVEGESFYFVHSYAAKSSDRGVVSHTTYHERFVAAIEEGAISAVQFHPEKSGKAGLALIKNWVESL